MNELQGLLDYYVHHTEEPEINFKLAIYYHSIGQTASAISYYIRTAERTENKTLMYACLLSASQCFDSQGCRSNSVKGLLQSAIAVDPKRPEGYFLLSRFYEREKNYHDSYLIASIGEKVSNFNLEPLPLNVDYPGYCGILFERAVSAWWCGLCDDSHSMFLDLKINYWNKLDKSHKQAVLNNLKLFKKQFDWGEIEHNQWFKDVIIDEVFTRNVYQKFFKVEEDDLVVDIGASVGPFTYKILAQNPKQVYCIEPQSSLFKTLSQNLAKHQNVTLINKGITSVNGEFETGGLYDKDCTETWEKIQTTNGLRFNTLLKENNIEKIDFLKVDCEGGEYDIFNEENRPWIAKNVRKIAGEFHLATPDQKKKFVEFRDTYLNDFNKVEIYSCDDVDIKWSMWDDWAVERYNEIIIYIDNTEVPENFWNITPWATMEFTTSIPKKGCVVDCAFCPQRILEKSYVDETRFLTLDNFKKMVDKLPQEIRVTFAGFTEPWLNKDCTDMLLYAHEKGHRIAVFTTGIGMKVDDVYRIKDVPYDLGPNGKFVLHLPDAERIAKHPITDNYIKVLEAFKEVHKDIQGFYTMAMGEVHPDVNHIFPEAVVPAFWNRAGNLVGEAMLKPELLNLQDRYKSIYHGEEPRTCGCDEHLYHNIALPNGDVSLCCMDYSLKFIIGNLLEQEYKDIAPQPNTCFDMCRFCENGVRHK